MVIASAPALHLGTGEAAAGSGADPKTKEEASVIKTASPVILIFMASPVIYYYPW
jgi:hypothetical protein